MWKSVPDFVKICVKATNIAAVRKNELFYFKKQNSLHIMTSLFKISPNFSINYINDILKITLKLNNLNKHFLYYLVKMLDIIE